MVMGLLRSRLVAILALVVAAGAAWGADAPAAGGGKVWAVTGAASRGDAKDIAAKGEPMALGMAAGRKAREACQGRQPDLVLAFVFQFNLKSDELRKQIMEGVAESFDKKIVYGCPSGLPADMGGRAFGVAVMALGGVEHTTVKAAVEKGKEEEAYAALAGGLKAPYGKAAGQGRLVLILGSNSKITKGPAIVEAFQKALGKDVQMFGPGIPVPATWQYYAGEVVDSTLTAILVTGDFHCTFGMADIGLTPQQAQTRPSGQNEDKIIESAGKGVAAALGDKKDDVAAVLVESCESRGHSLAQAKSKKIEETAVADAAKGVPAMLMVWSYGWEIGHAATGEAAQATRSRIMVCAIRQGAGK